MANRSPSWLLSVNNASPNEDLGLALVVFNLVVYYLKANLFIGTRCCFTHYNNLSNWSLIHGTLPKVSFKTPNILSLPSCEIFLSFLILSIFSCKLSCGSFFWDNIASPNLLGLAYPLTNFIQPLPPLTK